MKQEIIEKMKESELLEIVNQEVRICIICGYEKIQSFGFGISGEEFIVSFGRKKC